MDVEQVELSYTYAMNLNGYICLEYLLAVFTKSEYMMA